MAEREYRAYVQSNNTIGQGFIEDIISVVKQGGELDSDQTRMVFPHNAVLFLKSNEVLENTPTITYTVLSQMFTSEDDLNALTIDEWRNEMKKVGIKARDRAAGTAEYINKFMPEKVAPAEVEETPVEQPLIEEVAVPKEEFQGVVEAPTAAGDANDKVAEPAAEAEVVPEVTVTKQRGRKAK